MVEEALKDVRAKVHRGVPIAQPLVENPVFPPLVSQMVKIGEETGELDAVLGKIEPIMMIGRRHSGRRRDPLDVPADVQGAHARQVTCRA